MRFINRKGRAINRNLGGVHFKIINGKIRGREMQSEHWWVGVVRIICRLVVASKPYRRVVRHVI